MRFSDITPADALNAILQSSNLGYREMEGNVLYIADIDKIGRQTMVRNIACQYAKAEDLQAILTNMVATKSGAVMADKRTNTLIIKERPDVVARMEHLVGELDRPTQQVYIQAEIVEVSSTNSKELGMEWLWKTANVRSLKGHVGTNFDLQTDVTDQGVSTGGSTTTTTEAGPHDGQPFPTGTGLGVGILNTDLEAVLHALQENNNVNLLSRPRVVTIDNHQSVIEVGDQIPYKQLNEFGVTSFEFKDATVQLLVTPHIINSGDILLEVAPKADFQNGFTPDGTPIISTRKASTTVKVRNGQTIVIGGLIRDSVIQKKSKVPILGDIPLLGLLFKNEKTSKAKTELIVFIRPVILEDQDDDKIFRKDFDLKNDLQQRLDGNRSSE